jgi:hypothetical protein
MTVLISPYNTSIFNNLLGFKVAGLKFDTANNKTIITDIITLLFCKHNVKKVLSL